MTPRTRSCPRCTQPMPEPAAFCRRCGLRLIPAARRNRPLAAIILLLILGGLLVIPVIGMGSRTTSVNQQTTEALQLQTQIRHEYDRQRRSQPASTPFPPVALPSAP